MRHFIFALLLLFSVSTTFAAVDSGYETAKVPADNCPAPGDRKTSDGVWNFTSCNCTSYTAYRLSQDWARIYGSQFKFHNHHFLDALSQDAKDNLVSRIDMRSLLASNDADIFRWSNAGRWGDIAEQLGARRDHPYLGMVAWWDEVSIPDVGHVAFVADVGTNPASGKPGVKVKEYNFDDHLTFDERWIDLDDIARRPDFYIDFTDLEYKRLVLNKVNHPEYFTWDEYCKENDRDDRVERFRTPDKGLLRTLVRTPLADTPDDRIWYYGFNCVPQLSAQLSQLWAENMNGIADGQGGGSLVSPLDLNLDFDVMHPQGYELYAGRDEFGPPLQVDLRARVEAEGANAESWMDAGKDTIEIDYYVRLGSNGVWQKIYRGYLTASKLTEGTTLQETYRYMLPDLPLDQISFQVVVDPEEEAEEVNEDNNKSRVEVFDFSQNLFSDCDLTASAILLDNGKTSLYEGDSYGLKGAVRNVGTTLCPNGIRSTYYERKPGQSTFVAMADDGSDQWELTPGRDQWEYTMDQPFLASIPGTHEIMFCADSGNADPETNEDNNCLVSTYDVLMYRPDLTVSSLSLCNGKTSLKVGDRFGLCLTIQNVGNKGSDGSRVKYELKPPGGSFTYQTDDAVASLPVGGVDPEETLDEPFMATAPGWWEARVTADYEGAITESDEGNNSLTFSFEVVPAVPDLMVADLFLTVGSSVIRNGGTVRKDSYVHPQCTAKNQGNGGATRDSYQYYYINATKYRDKDVDTQGEMCAGCSVTHGVAGNSIRLGDTGSRTYRCCVDATGVIAESDEGNNCATIGFTVR